MRKELVKTLSWEVKEVPVTLGGTTTEFKNFKGLVRSDNDGQLHIAKKSYSPLFNSDFVSTLEKLSEVTGMPIEGYNDFNGGKRVLGFLRNNQENFKIGGYDAKDFLLLGNSHDGSSSIYFGTSDELIRCTNQWSRILATIKIRHSANKQNKIDQVIMQIENNFKERKLYFENLERFGEIKVDSKVICQLVDSLLDIQDRSDISTRKENQLREIEDSIATEMKDLGVNMFGLFNGITHYTTHKAEPKKGNSFGNVFGKQGEFNEKVYEFGLNLIESRPALITV